MTVVIKSYQSYIYINFFFSFSWSLFFYYIDGETKFLSQLEETGWLKHVQSCLTASVRLVEMMDRELTSVLIHCSDGWDRTAQIGACAQIMMVSWCFH